MSDPIFEELELLEEEFGPGTHSARVPESAFAKYRGVLPHALLTIWQHRGWKSYENGLFWIVDPEPYQELVERWLENTPFAKLDRFHVIARSAFGTLYAWGQRLNTSITISCPVNAIIALASDLRERDHDPSSSLGSFFLSRERDSFDLKDENAQPLFTRALQTLGPLAADEVYGFEPPLFAGGRFRLENLHRLKLAQHLAILHQLGGVPRIPFANFKVDID